MLPRIPLSRAARTGTPSLALIVLAIARCSWMPDIEYAEQLDWEVELTVVIAKRCRNVKKERALDYVLGYTVGNDVSSRHWQKQAGAGQWIKGKSFDTFCPLGPVLVTRAAIPDPQTLQVTTRVNGAVQQHESTSDMIFTVAECIEWLSNNMTLLPGTVIMTGTPSGVAAGRMPPNFLKVCLRRCLSPARAPAARQLTR